MFGTQQPHELARVHRGREDHGKGETETLGAGLADPGEHAGGDGRPGARETPKRQAQALHRADDSGLRGAHGIAVRTDRAPPFAQPRNEDQDAACRQRRGNPFEMSEQILDLRAGYTRECRLLDEQFQALTDYAGQRRGHDHPHGRAFELGHAGKIRRTPAAPEVHDDGKHGAGMQHHQQQRHRGGRRIQTHELFGHHDVRGTGNRQQLGQALHDGKDDHF